MNTLTIIFLSTLVFGAFVFAQYVLLKRAKEESAERREAWSQAFAMAVKASKSNTVEEFSDTIDETDKPLPEQENDEMIDMYNVNEDILIKKLVEENDNKQNQNKKG